MTECRRPLMYVNSGRLSWSETKARVKGLLDFVSCVHDLCSALAAPTKISFLRTAEAGYTSKISLVLDRAQRITEVWSAHSSPQTLLQLVLSFRFCLHSYISFFVVLNHFSASLSLYRETTYAFGKHPSRVHASFHIINSSMKA